jgi:hypothetical protein
MPRHLVPELLDSLPPDDPRAMRSRRDLQRLNVLMRNDAFMARALRSAFADSRPARMIEIGAGDGTFLLQVGRRLCRFWPNVNVSLLDQQMLVRPETVEAFEALGWSANIITADVFDWLEQSIGSDFDAIVANLFLHHFSETQLAQLTHEAARRTRAFVAIEPRRSAFPLLCSKLLWVIGCNDVTRHDAVASVRAGFAGSELTQLWPETSNWSLRENRTRPFGHCFAASRVARS